jgi:hypothetical protein
MNKVGCTVLFSVLLMGTAAAQNDQNSAVDGSDRSGPPPFVIPAGSTSRYIVTYMNSQTTANFRSATVISVNNQSPVACSVTVEYFKGFVATAACTSTASIAAGFTHDFCSRAIPGGATTCNSTCSPGLVFDEGRARVASTADANGQCANIGVDARLYHFTGTTADVAIAGIASPAVVRIGQGNAGQ